jgi:DNA-directed RNA polymerase III subunit RPC1
MLSVSTDSCSPQKQFDAALYSKEDAIEGVSECIIMGNPAANCGTSMSVIRDVLISRPRV